MLDLRAAKVLVLGALAMLLVLTMPSLSTAIFTSSSTNTGTVRAAADWTEPVVFIVDLPAVASGIETVTAQASDDVSGVASVTIQTRPSGSGTWTALCTDTIAPYQCSWDTTALPDGDYDVMAEAADHADNHATSPIATTTVVGADTTGPSVSIVGVNVRDNMLTVTASASDLSGVRSVHIEYSLPRNGTWQPLCSGVQSSSEPTTWSCTLRSPHNGQTYFRAIATDMAGNVTTSGERHTPLSGSTSSTTSAPATEQAPHTSVPQTTPDAHSAQTLDSLGPAEAGND